MFAVDELHLSELHGAVLLAETTFPSQSVLSPLEDIAQLTVHWQFCSGNGLCHKPACLHFQTDMRNTIKRWKHHREGVHAELFPSRYRSTLC